MPEIRDPLYGDISVSETETQVLNTKEFQRLRWLYQLPLSHFVFPGATHTRFSHSIGVMELATRIANGIKERAKIMPKDIESLRIAALLHDIDEPPFYPIFKEKYPGRRYYPKIRKDILERIYQQIEAKIDYERTLSILEGKDECRFLNQIIDSEVGANRIDYLLRDAFYCGVSYGNIDLRILYEFETKNQELVLKKEAIPLVDTIFNCLYQMKVNIYDHRVGRSISCMLFSSLEQASKTRYKIEDFFELTDEEFLRILAHADKVTVERIRQRDILKAAYCVDAYMLRDFKVSQYLESYRRHREELEKEISQRVDAKISLDFVTLRPAPATSIKARMNGDYVDLSEVPLLKKWYSEKPYEQWKLYVFCEPTKRKIASEVCDQIFGFLEVGRVKEPKIRLRVLDDFYKDIHYLKEKDFLTETKQKILVLPSNEQLSLKTLAKLGSATAREMAIELQKSRSTESIVLNNLNTAGLATKQKVKKRIIFYPTAIVITALNDLGLL